MTPPGPLVRIAFVDDEPGNVRTFVRFLGLGMPEATVVTGSDGRDAIALRFADPPPDLVFINGEMPEMDGWEAVAAIRAREQAEGVRGVPIILESACFVSASLRRADGTVMYSDRIYRDRALEAGADLCLTLPFDPMELLAFIRALLRQSPGTRERSNLDDARGPRIVTEDEWRSSGGPPRSPRGYAFAIAQDRATWRGDAEDGRESGVTLYRLARFVVEAAEAGLVSGEEAAACLGLDDDAHRAVDLRLRDLGGPAVRIAVVDDQPANIRVLERILGLAMPEATVVSGSDGRDAVALRFADPPPDLMFINGEMPEMDGWEAVAAIRAGEQADGVRAIPIILNSGLPTRTYRDRALEAGADLYLTLPLDPTETLTFIRVLFGQSPGTRERSSGDDARGPLLLGEEEWLDKYHPPRSTRGYAFAFGDAGCQWRSVAQVLAMDPPGSPMAAEDARVLGVCYEVSLYRLARFVVEAAETGAISAEEAAACLGPDDGAFHAVQNRLWDLGCPCDWCAPVGNTETADAPEGGDGSR
jgi:CheY-like chemotaxis protein